MATQYARLPIVPTHNADITSREDYRTCSLCEWYPPLSDDTTAAQRHKTLHMLGMHPNHRFFCNSFGCTYSASFKDRDDVRKHAAKMHPGENKGETLRTPGTGTAQPSPTHIRNPHPNRSSQYSNPLAQPVRSEHITTYSSLSNALGS